jgi:YbbR domain-containing protein
MAWFFQNLGWKLLSLVVAFAIWFVVMSSNSIEITKEVTLDLTLPNGLVVANEVPERVSFRLSGSKFFLRTLANSLDTLKVDLSRAKAGPTFYRIEKDALHLPLGVKVLSISPSTITPLLEPVDRRLVPVEIVQRGSLPNGYRLVRMTASPSSVRLRGPRSALDRISVVKSLPVDLSDIPAELKWEVPVVTGSANVTFEEETAPKVVVEVEPTGSNFRVAGVPISVRGAKSNVRIEPEKVSLYVNCPPNLIRTLSPERVRAVVALDGAAVSGSMHKVEVDLPPGVRLVRVVPAKVRVVTE